MALRHVSGFQRGQKGVVHRSGIGVSISISLRQAGQMELDISEELRGGK